MSDSKYPNTRKWGYPWDRIDDVLKTAADPNIQQFIETFESEFPLISEDEYDSIHDPSYWMPKCECGADKAGSPFHSHWCPKYEDPAKSRPKPDTSKLEFKLTL